MASRSVTGTQITEETTECDKLPSIETIRKAIPPECFERSFCKSLFYLILDFAVIAILYYTVSYFECFGFGGLLIWYWLMGMFGSSLFVVGHDCGHGTFSEYTFINDLFGHIAHAPILAPYWPWQKSHRQHHQFTSHLDKDKGHPWTVEEEYKQRNSFVKTLSKIPITGLVRWNPIYTMVGLPDGSHFWPYSRLFTNNRERLQCCISGLACLTCAYVAFRVCDYSIYTFLKYYYVPILFQGLWLIIITYLQHHFEEVEVYEEGHWNYVRGQLQTVDRTFGFGIDSALHHITDGHVAHHFFFTRIPHYHLMEATNAIQNVLEPYKGAYKRARSWDFVWKFVELDSKLEYLIGKGSGILKFAKS
ncbi:unnamed protein product [Anisakis simplex]|uniref:FA_desaturase domain-containing protein n=1 Tax=Anisakis simplex TaxID=6269 RepID=A0A0M3IZH2_ANISI|nr:unnamed protein product [Anisakis simplex]